MTISHGGYAFESITSHEAPIEITYEHSPKVGVFYGVPGSIEIRDALHGREIRIPCIFRGYATQANLMTALATIDSKVGSLNDATLSVNATTALQTYYHCSFRGFERSGGIRAVISSSTTWEQEGTLVFYQLNRSS